MLFSAITVLCVVYKPIRCGKSGGLGEVLIGGNRECNRLGEGSIKDTSHWAEYLRSVYCYDADVLSCVDVRVIMRPGGVARLVTLVNVIRTVTLGIIHRSYRQGRSTAADKL